MIDVGDICYSLVKKWKENPYQMIWQLTIILTLIIFTLITLLSEENGDES